MSRRDTDPNPDAIRAGVRALTGFTDHEIDELGGIGRGDTDSGGELAAELARRRALIGTT